MQNVYWTVLNTKLISVECSSTYMVINKDKASASRLMYQTKTAILKYLL